ncbi:MAG: hypothetical protein JWQ42_2727 [Edaphobacter sp.]|nr:hypothetical protein [Edaphobacter sp.]
MTDALKVTTADFCHEQDLRCAILLDELRREEWGGFHVAFIRIAAKQDWQRMRGT